MLSYYLLFFIVYIYARNKQKATLLSAADSRLPQTPETGLLLFVLFFVVYCIVFSLWHRSLEEKGASRSEARIWRR